MATAKSGAIRPRVPYPRSSMTYMYFQTFPADFRTYVMTIDEGLYPFDYNGDYLHFYVTPLC